MTKEKKESVFRIIIITAGSTLLASVLYLPVNFMWTIGNRVDAIEKENAVKDIKFDVLNGKQDLTLQRTAKILCLFGEKSNCE